MATKKKTDSFEIFGIKGNAHDWALVMEVARAQGQDLWGKETKFKVEVELVDVPNEGATEEEPQTLPCLKAIATKV